MGLFDSVVGAVLNNAGQAGGNAAGGGLGGLLGMAAQNPQLVQAVLSLLSNDGAHGGLAGLVERFQQAGLDQPGAARFKRAKTVPARPSGRCCCPGRPGASGLGA